MPHTAFRRRLVYVVNPAAGKGKYLETARTMAREAHADALHLTEGVGECIDYIAAACLLDPDTHFVVCGGDGTAGEAATGIMRAGAGQSARLTVIPAGSGNDFHRGIAAVPLPEGEDSISLDLMLVNGRYVLNMLNVGFDCAVVSATEAMRRGGRMPGSLSYLAGVASVLRTKPSFHAGIRLTDVVTPGQAGYADEVIEGDFLLTAIGNLPFCGGGFKGVPAATPTDGMIDILIARDMTRMQFLSLIGGYRSGRHVNPETLTPYPQYAPYIEYRRCRAVSFSGVREICLDGEVIPATGVRAEAVPAAIRYVPAP